MTKVIEGYTYEGETDKDVQVEKLTDFKNPPSLRSLKRELESARAETADQVARVEDWIDAYNGEGKYAAPDAKDRSKMVIRLVRKQAEWRCPSLTEPFLSSPKLFEVQPRTHEDRESAKQNELLLNYQFKNKINSVRLMDNIVRTAAIEGTAIVKTSWVYKEDVYPETITEYEIESNPAPDRIQQLTALIQQVQQDPSILDSLDERDYYAVEESLKQGVILDFIEVGSSVEDKVKVKLNHPNAELCEIDDIFVDPTCKGDFKKAKFIIERFDTCLAALREDGRYKNLDALEEEVANHEQNTKSEPTKNFNFDDIPRKNLEAFEYWGYYDIDGTGILHSFVATWVGKTLIRMERNPYPDNGLPYTFIPLLPVKKSIYGEPDAELIKENQQIMSATMRGAIDLFARSANGQTGTAKGFLDSTNTARFNSGRNYTFNPSMDPSRAVHVSKFNEIPNSVFNMLNFLTNDSESFSGVKAFSNGITGDALGKTVGAAKGALDATAKRDASILRRLAEGLVDIAYKFQTMNAIFLTDQDVIRLTNSEFVSVDKDNLSGDFDLIIDISTAEADQQKANDLGFLLQTGQGNFPFEFTQQILAEIARLKKQVKLEQFILGYQPQPDPLADKMKELEIAKLEADIAETQARTMEARAKAMVHEAEIGVRSARAANTQSVTDKNTIQTYKDANGITQEEKLQLEDAKQRNKANDDLRKHDLALQAKATDHNLGLRRDGAKQELDALSYAQEADMTPNNPADNTK